MSSEPSVLLPAHDPDAATRLANRQCMFDAEPDAKDPADNVANNAKTTLRAYPGSARKTAAE